ncbi:MAG TPA: DinB family protein [Rhodothermales bacterium]|nr:DinB family protein [Rhodothermales bacterium]
MSDPATAFIEKSRYYLQQEYLPKIERCVEKLSDEDLWWRPNDQSNSVGNLLLHLAGNVQQWIVSGVGGANDVRQRQQEFDERERLPRRVLMERLRRVLDEMDQVFSSLDASALLEPRQIQGLEVSVLDAVYHVVEHFSMHVGQIIYLTKMRTGDDLGFYRVKEGDVVGTRWHEAGA